MRVAFYTLGCKVNQYETQALRELFLSNGFREDALAPEVILLNSCTVTATADKKSRQLLRRLRRAHPHAVIALTGCMPQLSPHEAQLLTEADIITGTKNKGALLQQVQLFLETGKSLFSVPPLTTKDPFEALSAMRFDEGFQRAYLKIEDGCDCFCSYCAIPYARGSVRSRSLHSIQQEVTHLLKEGYRELVLTGINLSRYGFDAGLRLPQGVAAAAALEGDYRVRLGSIEPVLITQADYEALAKEPRLCPQFHLALQSGCDQTLKRMGRRYNTQQYTQTVAQIQSLFDNPSLTTDIIVGFPGETEAEFEETCAFVQNLPLLRAHIFAYSPRAGTPAASMDGQVSDSIKKQRTQILSKLCQQKGQDFARAQVGKLATVLVEANGLGYTENYLSVLFEDTPPQPYALVRVRLTGVTDTGCTAKVMEG